MEKKGQESIRKQGMPKPRICSFGHDISYIYNFFHNERDSSWNMSSFQKGVKTSRSSWTSTGLLGEFLISALEVPTLRRLLSSWSSLIGKACHRYATHHHGFTSSSLSWPPRSHDESKTHQMMEKVMFIWYFRANLICYDIIIALCHVLSCHNPPPYAARPGMKLLLFQLHLFQPLFPGWFPVCQPSTNQFYVKSLNQILKTYYPKITIVTLCGKI